MSNQIDNHDDYIDSRDIIARIEELEAIEEPDEEEREELAGLIELAKEGEDYSENWKYGAQLIRDSYFEQYAMEFAEDMGVVDRDMSWPNNCIDWERAARELQMDYTSIDFDGITYWVR